MDLLPQTLSFRQLNRESHGTRFLPTLLLEVQNTLRAVESVLLSLYDVVCGAPGRQYCGNIGTAVSPSSRLFGRRPVSLTLTVVKLVLEMLLGINCPRQGRHKNPELAFTMGADCCRWGVAEPFRHSKSRLVKKDWQENGRLQSGSQ